MLKPPLVLAEPVRVTYSTVFVLCLQGRGTGPDLGPSVDSGLNCAYHILDGGGNVFRSCEAASHQWLLHRRVYSRAWGLWPDQGAGAGMLGRTLLVMRACTLDFQYVIGVVLAF